MKKEFSNIKDPQGEWICPCGNDATREGFFPCDKKGEDREPTIGWLGLYKCYKCGAIVDLDGNIRGYADMIDRLDLEGLEPLKAWPTDAMFAAFQSHLFNADHHLKVCRHSLTSAYAMAPEAKRSAAGIVLLTLLESLNRNSATLQQVIDASKSDQIDLGIVKRLADFIAYTHSLLNDKATALISEARSLAK